ncbi:MAG: flagellar type III secretion system pore protein FliP [Gammaproteobacteria bacterium]|nr:flagellar type III secretion system pore protein FliP [Gammaproteobacteria bacterium]MCF6363729.1 flagellar type III secretion system pore protein FliP [Gammaproteobacteria bacterium]
MRGRFPFIIALSALLFSGLAQAAEPGLQILSVTTEKDGGQTYSVGLQILALMTAFSLLPAALIMLTSFTRIIIVLAIVRQAVGMPQAPSGQILIGLALFLTFFVMSPVFTQVYDDAVVPYLDEKIEAKVAFERASLPFREFMLAQTRDKDLSMFADIAGSEPIDDPADVPFSLLMPSFITSELKTAYQIGFLIFIPFLIIDLVVASVLMAMGMMMLSPMIISLPFKIMLFVLVDGWAMIMGTLASSFYV